MRMWSVSLSISISLYVFYWFELATVVHRLCSISLYHFTSYFTCFFHFFFLFQFYLRKKNLSDCLLIFPFLIVTVFVLNFQFFFFIRCAHHALTILFISMFGSFIFCNILLLFCNILLNHSNSEQLNGSSCIFGT